MPLRLVILPSLLGSEASADEPAANVDVVEDQDCHFKSKAGEEQSELSEPNDCLAAAGECQSRSACSSRDTLSYDIGEIVVECKSEEEVSLKLWSLPAPQKYALLTQHSQPAEGLIFSHYFYWRVQPKFPTVMFG